MIKDIEYEKHPAFGLASFSRVSGGHNVFFGSSVRSDHFITLTVMRASRRHDLGQDWIGPADNLPIVEVGMTSTQFAELLTSMNVGHGVPCTLRYVNGKRVEPIVEQKTEASRVKEHFKQINRESVDKIKAERERIFQYLNKDKLSKADRMAMKSLIDEVVAHAVSSNPFYLEQFEEATQKLATEAKAEVDAFITHAVIKTGLEHLRNQSSALGEKPEEKLLATRNVKSSD